MKFSTKLLLIIFIFMSLTFVTNGCTIVFGGKNNNDNSNIIIKPNDIINKNLIYHTSGIQRELFDFLEKNYYQDLDKATFYNSIDKSTQAFIDSFTDRYTRVTFNEAVRIISPTGSSEKEKEVFNGYGFTYELNEKNIIVTDILKNGNAKNKLYPKDKIIGLINNGEKVYFKNLNLGLLEFSNFLKEGASETVPKTFIVERNNEEINIDIYLKPFYNSSVEKIETKNPNYGAIRINKFDEYTGNIFLEILNDLENNVLTDENKTLIIDVRNNPGGVVTSLGQIVENLLVKKNKPYFILERNHKEKNPTPLYQVNGKLSSKKVYDIKVLTNRNSASASEILAAVLHYGQGYEIIGEETFGKNVYQDHAVLANGFVNLSYTRGFWKYYDYKEKVYKKIDKEKNPIHVTKLENLEVYDFFEIPYLTDKNIGFDTVKVEIKYIQDFLNYYFRKDADFKKIRNDGYFDKDTEKYIEKFQQQNNVKVTKIIDIETKNKIYDYYLDLLFTVEKDIFYNHILK